MLEYQLSVKAYFSQLIIYLIINVYAHVNILLIRNISFFD